MPASINRCRCSNRSFDELKQIAEQNRIRGLKKLKKQAGMNRYCQACAPYVHIMLKTGQTEFEGRSVA